MPGKIKTTSQMIAIILLILNNVVCRIKHSICNYVYICLFFTIYSGIDYFVQNRNVFSDGFN